MLLMPPQTQRHRSAVAVVCYSHETPELPAGHQLLAGSLSPGPTVVKPAILLRRRLDWMMATSSAMRLLVSKSSVRRL